MPPTSQGGHLGQASTYPFFLGEPVVGSPLMKYTRNTLSLSIYLKLVASFRRKPPQISPLFLLMLRGISTQQLMSRRSPYSSPSVSLGLHVVGLKSHHIGYNFGNGHLRTPMLHRVHCGVEASMLMKGHLNTGLCSSTSKPFGIAFPLPLFSPGHATAHR